MIRLRDLGEFEMIDLIAHHQPAARGRLIKGIGDDCAVIAGDGDQVTVVTTDTMVEGVHFDLTTSTPEGLGAKLLAVNLSDIAAMGGAPREAFLAMSASPDFDATILERLVGGLQASGFRFGVQLAGGDTTSTHGPLVLTLTMIGSCRPDRVIYRSGASVGDSVFVTGYPGESAAGLDLSSKTSRLDPGDREHLLRRHHRPEPRLAIGQGLADRGIASSMIDVSDGLAGDLAHICRQSAVDIVIDPTLLPVSDALRAYCDSAGRHPTDLVLGGGEDYELAFTANVGNFPTDWTGECRLTYIGKVIPGPGSVRIGTDEDSQTVDNNGFDHFSGGQGGTFQPV